MVQVTFWHSSDQDLTAKTPHIGQVVGRSCLFTKPTSWQRWFGDLWRVFQHADERDLMQNKLAVMGDFGIPLTTHQKQRLTERFKNIENLQTLRPRNPVPDSRTLLVFTKTLRVHIPISTPVRGVSWCVANPIDALDLPNASPTFMLPNLPRMMFYLDLVRRGKKTFVTLQVERLDRGSRSEVLPLFLSVSLRKHLHDGELDYGGQLNREMEKALTSAKLESLQRHESVAIVFPSESSDGMERFSEMMDATKWEIHFSASRASEDELGCLEVQADTATWKVGNAKKVLDCGGVSSEPFSLTGLRGTWTMDLKSSTVGPVFSLWPPPVHRPIRYELELGPSEAGNRQLAQCSPIPGFEATFPLDLPKLLDSSGSLQMRLRLLRCERSEGFVVFPDGDSCVLMWRLGQVACFLDASSIWSSPVFCIRGTENWEGCLWMESNLDRALLLQLRWPPTRGATPGAPQLSAKVGPSRWMDAREAPGESLVFNFGPFDTLSDSLDPVSDSLLIMLRIHGTSADHLKLRSTA